MAGRKVIVLTSALTDNLLCCTCCGSFLNLDRNDELFRCERCLTEYPIKQDIVVMLPELSRELALSMKKWDDYYRYLLKNDNYKNNREAYMNDYFSDLYGQLNAQKRLRDIIYLEVGCGPFYFGQGIANECKLVIGIDVSFSALVLAKRMLEEASIENYLLIQGDILDMPLRSLSVDLIYGGGVIEHFKDTQRSVTEMYRVLAEGGVCFNSVPVLNLTTLYRQFWGNIPDVPILKQAAEFIHITLLKSRHMVFGYELAISSRKLKRIHRAAGFNEVRIERFDTVLQLRFLPRRLRGIATWLCRHSRLFWPMVKAIGVK